jgi:hypothetical protein
VIPTLLRQEYRSALRILRLRNSASGKCLWNHAAQNIYAQHEKANFVFDINLEVSVVFPRKCNAAFST